MKQLSRVVWSEGMHLAQHHFQAQSRYFEDAIHFAVGQLHYRAYGLAGITLDADALLNGTVSLLHARGVMPDGLAFNIPEGDPQPEPREIADVFSPTHDSHVVHLVVPPFRSGGANVHGLDDAAGGAATRTNGHAAANPPRYRQEMRLVVDETSGRDEKPVGLGRKNFRLALDIELAEGEVALPIARVRRDGKGHFVYDEAFIPPLLQVGASEPLLTMLRRLVEMLDAKGETLGARRRPDAMGEFASREVASFWLLHTIHASLPVLRHHLEARRTRPDELFVEMSRLGGALCTFALQSHPRTLPLYDHDDLAGTFGQLERHIRAHLDVVIPEGCLTVQLARETSVLHAAPVADPRAFGAGARWILGVRAASPVAELARTVPQFAKVCSHRFVLKLVERAMPGLAMEYLSSPPSAIAPRTDTAYFALTRAGPCWDTLVQTKAVGVYVPDAVPGAEVALYVVTE